MTYTIANGDQVITRLHLDTATRKANELAAQTPGTEFKVIHVETDAVVYATSARAIANREHGQHFVPWTRLENPRFVAPDFEGYVPAYTRKRILATVYRKNDYERGAVGSWRVFDGRTGRFQDVRSTKEACALTGAMRLGKHL